MSAYDFIAKSFDFYRALPAGVAEAIGAAILRAVDLPSPRILDLGAGTGRIGRAFVAAGGDYVGVDLSLGMLREFTRWANVSGIAIPRLVQADGECLPFPGASFDTVLLIQVMGAVQNWRQLIMETRRVLQPYGVLIIGRSVMPPDGIDAHMKLRLGSLMQGSDVPSYHRDVHGEALQWLQSRAESRSRIIAASWRSEGSPRAFIDRQRTGARFAALPAAFRNEALNRLAEWAMNEFGSLDISFCEQHEFELQVFKFTDKVGRQDAG